MTTEELIAARRAEPWREKHCVKAKKIRNVRISPV